MLDVSSKVFFCGHSRHGLDCFEYLTLHAGEREVLDWRILLTDHAKADCWMLNVAVLALSKSGPAACTFVHPRATPKNPHHGSVRSTRQLPVSFTTGNRDRVNSHEIGTRIVLGTHSVVTRPISVCAPLHNIPMHVVKAPGIGSVATRLPKSFSETCLSEPNRMGGAHRSSPHWRKATHQSRTGLRFQRGSNIPIRLLSVAGKFVHGPPS